MISTAAHPAATEQNTMAYKPPAAILDLVRATLEAEVEVGLRNIRVGTADNMERSMEKSRSMIGLTMKRKTMVLVIVVMVEQATINKEVDLHHHMVTTHILMMVVGVIQVDINR